MAASVSTSLGSDALYDKPWRGKSVYWHPKQIRLDSKLELSANLEQVARAIIQRREGKAMVMFVSGLFLVIIGITKLGLLLEITGFLSLFKFGTILHLLKNTDYFRSILNTPVMKVVLDRLHEENTRENLIREIETYQPIQDVLRGQAHFPRVNILLMGPVGVGKSSFFNTINSIFRGKIFNIARSGNAEHSLTKKFRRYPVISNSNNKPMRFCLCDAMGLETNHLMDTENMKYVLDGHIEDKYMLDPSASITPNVPGFNKRPNLEDRIHCVAIVIDASTVDAVDAIKDTIHNIKEMQVVMNNMDIPQVIILTNVDKVCKETKYDASNALKSKLIATVVGKVSDMFGLPQHNIYPVKNYETECELEPNVDILALLALKGILNNADAHLFMQQDEIVNNYSV